MTQSLIHITLIGAGNVGYHLAQQLSNAPVAFDAVFSRNPDHAVEVAAMVHSKGINHFSDIPEGSDLYLISLADQAAEDFIRIFKPKSGVVAHTSGSLDLAIMHQTMRPHGVIYPLQTFSRAKPVNFDAIPVCTEASDTNTLLLIDKVAHFLSPDVRHINSAQRRQTHLAAVFACNFTNFMYVAAADILKKHDLEFDILRPLLNEFFTKANLMDPWAAQTGPAIRGDQNIISTHLEMLNDLNEYKQLYRLLSTLIENRKESEKQV